MLGDRSPTVQMFPKKQLQLGFVFPIPYRCFENVGVSSPVGYTVHIISYFHTTKMVILIP